MQTEKYTQLKKPRFSEIIVKANGLAQNGFDCWVFCPGMQFSAPDKWWGDYGPRDFPHEGIDICLYADRSGRVLRLDQDTQIPVLDDGVVRAVFSDYLGKAIIVEHENPAGDPVTFLSIYAHTNPLTGVGVGARVREAEVIATIADTSRSKANIRPHLHFSIGLPSPSLSYESFVWNIMRNPEMVTLLDPLAVTELRYRSLDLDNPHC